MPGDRVRGLVVKELERLFLRAPFGVVFLDRACRCLWCNEAFARLSGLAANPGATRSMADMVPSLWPALEPLLERAHTGDVVSQVVVTSPEAAGGVSWRVTAYPVPLAGHATGVGLAVDDLTTEPARELPKRGADAAAAEHIAAIASWSLDIGSGRIYRSPAMFELYDLPADEGPLDDDRILGRVHPEDRRAVIEARRAAMAGLPQDVTYRLVLPDGAVRKVRSIGEVHRGLDARPIRVSGTMQDVTERRQIEAGGSAPAPGQFADRRRTAKALAESERHLRALSDELEIERSHLLAAQSVARMGSWLTDLHQMTVTWSEQTHRIFETDPATFWPTHDRFLARVHPADRIAVDQAFVASFGSRATHTIEHRIMAADGRVKFVSESWRVTQSDDGTPLRATGTIQDITERKEAEERVRAADARLRIFLNNAPVIILAIDRHGIFTMAEGRGLEAAGLEPPLHQPGCRRGLSRHRPRRGRRPDHLGSGSRAPRTVRRGRHWHHETRLRVPRDPLPSRS